MFVVMLFSRVCFCLLLFAVFLHGSSQLQAVVVGIVLCCFAVGPLTLEPVLKPSANTWAKTVQGPSGR